MLSLHREVRLHCWHLLVREFLQGLHRTVIHNVVVFVFNFQACKLKPKNDRQENQVYVPRLHKAWKSLQQTVQYPEWVVYRIYALFSWERSSVRVIIGFTTATMPSAVRHCAMDSSRSRSDHLLTVSSVRTAETGPSALLKDRASNRQSSNV